MNTLPVVDLKATQTPLSANRVASGLQVEEGEDFSSAFKDALHALAEEDKPVDEGKSAKQKDASEKIEEQAKADAPVTPEGQNMPPEGSVVPAKVAEVMPVVLQAIVIEASALDAQTVQTTGSAAIDLVQAAKKVVDVTAGITPQSPVQALQVTEQTLQQSQAQAGLMAPEGQSQVANSSQKASERLANQALPSAGLVEEKSGLVMGVTAPIQSAADDGAVALPALPEQPRPVAQQVTVTQSARDVAMPQQLGVPVVTADDVSSLDGDSASIGSVTLAQLSSGEATPSLSDQAWINAVLSPVSAAAVATTKRTVELPVEPMIELALPDVAPAGLALSDPLLDQTRPDDAVPLAGINPALGVSQSLPATPAVSAPPVQQVSLVPAAQLNGEIVKFAGAGGGRAVMEITSPDLGALKIDLSIDGKGVARMVVEASTSAARDQLEQGMRRLHDDFAGLGLSLNVDLRQGSGGAGQRDAWQQPRFAVMSTTSAERVAAMLPEPVAGSLDDQTRIHFYA
ncbi:MAG: hypothetical protein RIR70_1160 [Pseudomonadota bacterium]